MIEDESARRLAAGMMMVGFEGTEVPRTLAERIPEGLGGVVYFSRNVRDREQVRRLSEQLQALSPGPPLFIAVDQEGGDVVRLEDGFSTFPAAMGFGAIRDESLAEACAMAVASELRSVGINMNLAPVLDVNTNPDNPVIGARSYSDDPRLVARMGAAAVRGYGRGGVLAVAKHFPGHGGTNLDSHEILPVVPRVRDIDLDPFRRGMSAGLGAIMTAHVAFSSFSDLPATLSPEILTGLLREEMGFQGMILTDCMEMSAVGGRLRSGEGAVRAVAAGADMVLFSHTLSLQRRVLGALTDAIQKGRLPRERVLQSAARLRALRKAIPGEVAPISGEGPSPREVAARAVTQIRGEGLFPLPGMTGRIPRGERGRGWEVTAPTEAIAERVATWCPGARVVRSTGERGILLFQRGAGTACESAAFSLRGPYALRPHSHRAGLACTYDSSGPSVSVTMDFLFRGAGAPGRLPVEWGS